MTPFLAAVTYTGIIFLLCAGVALIITGLIVHICNL